MPISTSAASLSEGGLGQALIGEKICINGNYQIHQQQQGNNSNNNNNNNTSNNNNGHPTSPTTVLVKELLGEGGFAYVYLVRDITDASSTNDDTTAPKRSTIRNSSYNAKLMKDNANSAAALSHANNNSNDDDNNNNNTDTTKQQQQLPRDMVLKVTSISSRQQREIAEKEAKLLMKLSHPSIVKMFDTAYRTIPLPSSSSVGSSISITNAFRSNKGNNNNNNSNSNTDSNDHNTTTNPKHNTKERVQHMILMEYCDGGHALQVCNQLKARNERFDISTLIIAFGQICNAVSYLHAQRPPIIHRDLKPENFLIKGGAYKLCDFGSAIFGHVELKTSKDRNDEEEIIERTTTQMFRAPEMVDLYMSKKLTQATDVWALGCCLYALAYLKNCFEEGSNLAIISRNYKIPDDNPYGDGLAELISRMLTTDAKCRADMTEVILCLSAVYSNKPLPPRKERKSSKEKETTTNNSNSSKKERETRTTTTATNSNNNNNDITTTIIQPSKVKEAKKLDPNSAAARRRQAAAVAANVNDLGGEFATFTSKFDTTTNNNTTTTTSSSNNGFNQDLAFSTTQNPFATSFDGNGNNIRSNGTTNNNNNNNMFDSFSDLNDSTIGHNNNDELLQAFSASSADWENSKSPERGRSNGRNRQQPSKVRSRSKDLRRKSGTAKKDETPEEALECLSALNLDNSTASDMNYNNNNDDDNESVMTKGGTNLNRKIVARRGVHRTVSHNRQQQPSRPSRSLSRGHGLRRTASTNSSSEGQLIHMTTNSGTTAASLYRTNYDDSNNDSDDEL